MKRLLAFILCVSFALAASARPPLVLVSIDAFRWDYCALHPAETPNLRRLAASGVTARALIPVFPSDTFPNHYSIVTGLYPAHHGIINNDMFDAATGEFFDYRKISSYSESRWWLGEPIWVTTIKQGGHAGTWFWVGSEAEIEGVRPDSWIAYDPKLPFETRLDGLISWLSRSRRDAPMLATFYLEEVNSVGHKFGPDSPELAAAVHEADTRIGTIVQRLRDAHIDANLVIVSDHGMTAISPDRVVFIDDFVDPAAVQVDFDGPVAGLRPRRGADLDALMRSFATLRHAKAYRVADLPARFHMTAGPRVPPIWIVPDEGWEIYSRAQFAAFKHFNRGDHGYDPAFASMGGIFIGHGPSFKHGIVLPPAENIHVYNLLCAALGLHSAPNDGDDRLARGALK